MAKKSKNKPTTINNIESVNLEIDYDKLAEAIVNAQEKAEKVEKNENENNDKQSLLNAIKLIMTNKVESNGAFLTGALTLVLTTVFKTISVIGFLTDICIFVSSILFLSTRQWNVSSVIFNLFLIIVSISIIIIVFLFSVIIWGASNEINEEKDKYYVVSVFSSIVSLTALIISAISLIKGVI